MNSIVAVYDTHEQAEGAIKQLRQGGVDLRSLSIAAKDIQTEEHIAGHYNTGDGMKYWGRRGAFWGGMWGLLMGSAMFAVSGMGSILVAGPLVAWIVASLEGAVIVGGVSAIGAGLISVGVPEDRVRRYDIALKTNKFLLVVHGSTDQLVHARTIIENTKHNSYFVSGETVPAYGSTLSGLEILNHPLPTGQ